jgi:hypothetical protein
VAGLEAEAGVVEGLERRQGWREELGLDLPGDIEPTRICDEVTLAWPKRGFLSSRMPARKSSRMMMRLAVRDVDMTKLLGTILSVP